MVQTHLMFLKAMGSHRRALKEKGIQSYGDVEGLLILRKAPEGVRIGGAGIYSLENPQAW